MLVLCEYLLHITHVIRSQKFAEFVSLLWILRRSNSQTGLFILANFFSFFFAFGAPTRLTLWYHNFFHWSGCVTYAFQKPICAHYTQYSLQLTISCYYGVCNNTYLNKTTHTINIYVYAKRLLSTNSRWLLLKFIIQLINVTICQWTLSIFYIKQTVWINTK